MTPEKEKGTGKHIVQSEDVKTFLSLARLALTGSFDSQDLQDCVYPLAQLLEAASRGVGQLSKSICLLPKNFPEAFFSVEGDFVLLPRYASCWSTVREAFQTRLQKDFLKFDDKLLKKALDDILPVQKESGFDNAQQRLAVATFIDAGIGVLTGGPGTGKTTCAAALLALRKRLEPELKASEVQIAAPTGKAACRLAESLKKALSRLDLTKSEKDFLLQLEPKTLHRTLEWTPRPPEQGGPFLRNAKRPLELKWLIVDEASMVDLELMAQLMEALPPHASLILLGDSDQLESVGTGGVLAELVERGSCGKIPDELLKRWERRMGEDSSAIFAQGCPPKNSKHSPLAGLVIGLKDSYRAKEAPWILDLASIAKLGSKKTSADFYQTIEANKGHTLFYQKQRDFDSFCFEQWEKWALFTEAWTLEKLGDTMPDFNEALLDFQLLCGSNAQVDRANQKGLDLLWKKTLKKHHGALPHGCPVLITANHYKLGLSNGDIGVALGAGTGSPAQILSFSGRDKGIALSQLPSYKPAFALTIHKAQGSEWKKIALDLPKDESELLNRNLLYTAITRSSREVHLFAEKGVLERLLDKG